MLELTLNAAGDVVVTDVVMRALGSLPYEAVRFPSGEVLSSGPWGWVIATDGHNRKLGMPVPGTEQVHTAAERLLSTVEAVREEFAAAASERAAAQQRAVDEKAAREAAAWTIARRASDCAHKHTKSETRGYEGSVSRNQNPAAAGGVCVVKTCLDCGSIQRTNSNGRNEEVGPWWADSVTDLVAGKAHATISALFTAELREEFASRHLKWRP